MIICGIFGRRERETKGDTAIYDKIQTAAARFGAFCGALGAPAVRLRPVRGVRQHALSLNSDITSDRDSYTRNLGSLTVTQKIEMKGLEWLDPDNSDNNFLVQTNENAKDAHFAQTFRIEET